MMRGVSIWSVATRAPNGEIEVTSEEVRPLTERHRAFRLPVIRGVAGLVQSLEIGFRALAISAAARLSDAGGGSGQADRASLPVIVLALSFAIGLFFVLPALVAALLHDVLGSTLAFWLVEGGLRVVLLVGYIAAINRVADLRRMFEYHGAEHMAIACLESGDPVTPDRVAGHSRLQPRCGTSFLLTLMVVATVLVIPLGILDWYWLLLSRVLVVPVAAGVSYEVLKWTGRHRHARPVRALNRPGLALQRLTTREPDRAQIEVAIAALEAVLAVESIGGSSTEEFEPVA